MTKYEDGLPTHIVYEKELLTNTLGQVLADGGYSSFVLRKPKNMLM